MPRGRERDKKVSKQEKKRKLYLIRGASVTTSPFDDRDAVREKKRLR